MVHHAFSSLHRWAIWLLAVPMLAAASSPAQPAGDPGDAAASVHRPRTERRISSDHFEALARELPPGELADLLQAHWNPRSRRQPLPPMHPLFRSREEAARDNAAGVRPRATLVAPPPGPPPAYLEDTDRLEERWAHRPDPDRYHAAAAAALALGDNNASSEAPNAAPPDSDRWQQVGYGIGNPDGIHHLAGRVSQASYAWDDEQSATVLWLGTTGGGLWRAIYLGLFFVWAPVSATLPGSPSVGAFLVDPASSSRILIGTGDWQRYGGSGMYYTLDSGASWRRANMSPTPGTFSAIVLDQATSDTVLASSDNGIWRSTNFGRDWTRVYEGLVTDLVQDPSSPAYWYAGAPDVGVLESDTNGTSFHPIGGNSDLTGSLGRISLAVAPSAANFVYALIGAWGGGWNNVFRSSDYGASWVPIDLGPPAEPLAWGQSMHANAIAVDPFDPDRLFVAMGGIQWTANATAGAVCWSRNVGPTCVSCTGSCIDGGHADFTSMVFVDSIQPGSTAVILANDGGYYLYDWATNTVSGSGNLFGLNAQQVMQPMGAFTVARGDPDFMLSGLQDNGIVRLDRNQTPVVQFLGGGDGGQVSISPHDAADWALSSGVDYYRYYRTDTTGSWRNVNCDFNHEWSASMLWDARPAGLDQLFTHNEPEYPTVLGDQNLMTTPLTDSETLTLTINEAWTTADLAAGDTITQVVTKVRTAVTGLAIGAGNSSGRLKVWAGVLGSEQLITVSSNRGAGPGTTGFGTGKTDTGRDSFAWWKPASDFCDWTMVHGVRFPTSPVFAPKQIEQALAGGYRFYLTGAWDRRLETLEGAALGSLTLVDRTPAILPPVTPGWAPDALAFADRSVLQPSTVYYTTANSRPSRALLSTNAGASWTDVTGDLVGKLPDTSYWQLIGNPANLDQLFLGTDVGVFRSDDRGVRWFRYMDGLPAVVVVFGMHLAYDGAPTPILRLGSYGQGWWERSLGLPDHIFSDGFESGGTTSWSSAVGSP